MVCWGFSLIAKLCNQTITENLCNFNCYLTIPANGLTYPKAPLTLIDLTLTISKSFLNLHESTWRTRIIYCYAGKNRTDSTCRVKDTPHCADVLNFLQRHWKHIQCCYMYMHALSKDTCKAHMYPGENTHANYYLCNLCRCYTCLNSKSASAFQSLGD